MLEYLRSVGGKCPYVIYLCIILVFAGCDSDIDHLTGDFYVGWVNDAMTTNVYYENVGIFYRELVDSVGHTDDYIVVNTIPLDSNNGLNVAITHYYIIDCRKYEQDPNQMKSSGITFFDSKKALGDAKRKLGIPDDLDMDS